MRYYFNTPDQIAADEAFNENNYTEALAHYKRALQTLNQLASQRNFKRRNNFLHAFAYVISEIISTKYEVIRTTINAQEIFNSESVDELWEEIPGLVLELETVFAEMNVSEDKEVIKDKLKRCYMLLADVCELISDDAIDELDENAHTSEVLYALGWLTKSMDYSKRANLIVSIDLHFGYLNLLEKGYKSNLDKNFLIKISRYISDNALFELPFSPMQTLELLSYQLLVAVENNDTHTANQFIVKFRELLISADVDPDHYIIEDIQNLIAKLPSEQETAPLKKRKFPKLNDEPSLNKNEEKTNTTEQLSKKTKAIILEDSANEGVNDVNTEAESMPLAIGNHSYPKDLPSMSRLINTTFFASSSDSLKQVKFKEISHSNAFVKTFNKIGENASNREFLANILSLFADFYCETKLPLKNTPLLAFELYENVLLLSPRHPVAIERIKNITNHPIIRDNNRYGSNTILTPSNTNTIFTDAMENAITQVEAFLFENIQKINEVLDKKVEFIANKLISKNIAGSKSAEIANQIKTYYEYFSTHERPTDYNQWNLSP